MIRGTFPTLRRRAAQARHTQLRMLAGLQAFDAAVQTHMAHGAMTGADPLTDSLYGQLEAPAAEAALPAVTYSAGMQTRWQRLVAGWRLWRCSAYLLDVPQGLLATHAPLAAGSLSEGTPQARVPVLHCTQRQQRCEVCPRFHAHRHGLAIGLDVAGQLDVVAATRQVEAQARDGHCEAAEVDHVHADVGPRVTWHEGPAYTDLQSHPVGVEGPPPVQHTQHRAHDGGGQGNGLQRRRIHAGQDTSGHAASGQPTHTTDAAWWLAAATLLAALASACLLMPRA